MEDTMEDRHEITLEKDDQTFTGRYVINRYVVNGGSPIAFVTIYALGTQQTAQVGDLEPEAVARVLLRTLVEAKTKAQTGAPTQAETGQ
jgi:hypothetical protein